MTSKANSGARLPTVAMVVVLSCVLFLMWFKFHFIFQARLFSNVAMVTTSSAKLPMHAGRQAPEYALQVVLAIFSLIGSPSQDLLYRSSRVRSVPLLRCFLIQGQILVWGAGKANPGTDDR